MKISCRVKAYGTYETYDYPKGKEMELSLPYILANGGFSKCGYKNIRYVLEVFTVGKDGEEEIVKQSELKSTVSGVSQHQISFLDTVYRFYEEDCEIVCLTLERKI